MNRPVDTVPHEPALAAIHNRLFFRLFQVRNTLDRQTIKELGITTVQWSVMGALSPAKVRAGMSFSELADYLGVSRQNLDGVLKRLEREAVDRRAKKVLLTPAGRAFWEALQPKIYEFYGQAVSGLGFDDKVSFVHFLNRLNDGMCRISLDSPAPAGLADDGDDAAG